MAGGRDGGGGIDSNRRAAGARGGGVAQGHKWNDGTQKSERHTLGSDTAIALTLEWP